MRPAHVTLSHVIQPLHENYDIRNVYFPAPARFLLFSVLLENMYEYDLEAEKMIRGGFLWIIQTALLISTMT